MHVSSHALVAGLTSIILLVHAQEAFGANKPSHDAFSCDAGQYIAYGESQWSLVGSTYESGVAFMSKFCEAS